MSRVAAVGAGAVVLVTVAAVAVGVAWDHRRAAVAAEEPVTTTDLVDQGGRPLSVERRGRLSVDFVGDRLVEGWGATSSDKGFAAVAVRDWESSGPVESATISAEDVDPAAVPTADVVVIALGTDDAGRGELIEPFSERYGALLESMVARNPRTAFVCLGTWLPDAAARSYDYAIRTQCQARGGRFRTLAEVYRASPDRAGSGPSDADHAAIASLVTGSITVSPN